MATFEQLPRRQHAKRNREAILAAARELYGESAEVPMCEVARRAGVGQATLYRNFPDRDALTAALLEEHFDGFTRLAQEHAGDPDAFFVLLRHLIETFARFHALGALVQARAGGSSGLARVRQAVGDLLRTPLRDAKAAGTVRRDLTVDDVFLVVAMVRGALERAVGAAGRAAAASRAMTLVVGGLSPHGAPA